MSSDPTSKPPASPTLTRLAGDALVETIDGPVELVKLVGKVMPVLTRFRDGSLGFRMMREIRQIEIGPQIELENSDGQCVRVGSQHVFVRSGGAEVRAADVAPGDHLEPGWNYPSGYVVPDAPEYARDLRGRPWAPAIVIAAIRAAGEGPLFGFSVNETKSYFLTFGARCRAQV